VICRVASTFASGVRVPRWVNASTGNRIATVADDAIQPDRRD
jgi:hypothetical protein